MKRRKFIRSITVPSITWPIYKHMGSLTELEADLYEFSVGKVKCTVFRDLMFTYKVSDYFMNAADGDLAPALKRYDIGAGGIRSPFIALLIQVEGRNILVDTGLGHEDEPITFGGQTIPIKGQLKFLLPTIGVQPADITDVILTHFHPDHIGGVFTGTESNYPNARFHVHQREWDYWSSSASDHENPLFKYFIERNIEPLAQGNINILTKDAQEIVDGITSIDAPGHTPGQIALLLHSEDQSLLYSSDAFLHPLHVERLDWRTVYDRDHDQARRTREKLLAIARSENAMINSFHFDFPGLGVAAKKGQGWEWTPVV